MRVINQDGGQCRELVLVDGLSPADVVLVHREALRVLRSGIDTAHLDAYSDDAWPPAVLHSHERALSLARRAMADGTHSRRADPGMGIDIDVRDDAQFEVLLDLAPHTINAEGRRGDRLVFSASDSGTSLWIAVTQEQAAEILSRLDALGIPPTVLSGGAELFEPVGVLDDVPVLVRLLVEAGGRPPCEPRPGARGWLPVPLEHS